jgi:hypothetical protein
MTTTDHAATNTRAALNALMKACGLSGESGTEQLYGLLSGIILEYDEQIRRTIRDSHDEGLCLDVNALLADLLVAAVDEANAATAAHR